MAPLPPASLNKQSLAPHLSCCASTPRQSQCPQSPPSWLSCVCFALCHCVLSFLSPQLGLPCLVFPVPSVYLLPLPVACMVLSGAWGYTSPHSCLLAERTALFSPALTQLPGRAVFVWPAGCGSSCGPLREGPSDHLPLRGQLPRESGGPFPASPKSSSQQHM